ncbi:MAG: C-terminal binding protein [Actinobacteria bacterium]|nr:C-terminal binding protein [Actinomycetota bacterium]MCI0545311.1 C-terminal binding protein [Actinomycetota bacterium]
MALVVYTDTADLDPSPGVEMLHVAGHDVLRLETRDTEAIVGSARGAGALITSYAPITADVLASLPTVEIVSILATGFDNVDVEAATRGGVCVANVGGAAAPDVAAHALALILALIRGLPRYLEAAQNAEWFAPPPVIPPRTTEMVLGVLGGGRIGRAVLTMASGVFGRTQFHDPLLGEDMGPARAVSQEELVVSSDVIVLALPLTTETSGLVDGRFIEDMKSGAYLVNVGRGGVVVSSDLRKAVEGGRLRGAAMDVLDVEPPPADHPLLDHPRILVTPHTAYLSNHTEAAYATITARSVIDWFSGAVVATSVNGIDRRSP